ncbi:SAVED domain-containing protein [Staphylococcus saprophyticus]|nr:SAVED domain-containing protein [Staphylococcus saprophyticus]
MVIISIITIPLLLIKKKKNESILGIFIFTSLNLITTSFGSFFNQLNQLLILLFYKKEKTIQLIHEFNGVNYTQLITGIVLLLVSVFILNNISNRLYILNINGYYSKSIEEHHKELHLSKFQFKEHEIDIIGFSYHNLSKENSELIKSYTKRKVTSFIEQSNNNKRAYTGIAPIPVVALIGSYMRRKKIDCYIEYDKNKDEYIYLNNKNKFPKLKLTISNKESNSNDLLLLVATTAKITDSQSKHFSHMKRYNLEIDEPKNNSIYSKKQLFNYRDKVINTIENISVENNNLNSIHLLCATQSCLALEIGKMIDSSRHPPIIIYQYTAEKDSKYSWGITLNSVNKEFLVRR